MYGIALKFLLKNWKLVLLLAGAAAIYFYMTGLYNQIETGKKDLAAANQTIGRLTAEQAALKSAVDLQNKEVEKWKKASEDAKKVIDAANKKADETRTKTNKDVAGILNQKRAADAVGAINSLVDGAKELKWSRK